MLTASHLYQHAACPRWPWNEFFGDPGDKRGPSAFLRKLLADGVQFEESVYARLAPVRVTYPRGDHAAGAAETLRLLRAGTPLVAQAVLLSGDRLGIADLLERRPGPSALGDFHYEPVEIKTARSVKPVYRLQLAFYAHLLADAQGVWPERAHVILADGSRESFAVADVREAYVHMLHDLERTRAGVEPPVHISSTCGDCPWEPNCLARAEAAQDVSLTYGLQRSVARALRRHGVHTLADLAGLAPAQVEQLGGVRHGAARQIVRQARALVAREPLWQGAAQFRDAETEIYFDIEGDPEHNVLYLFGVLVRTRDGAEEYRPFVAETPEEEGAAFATLLECLEAHPGAPIYHYHHYERAALRLLATRHAVDAARLSAVLGRLHDLNRDLMSSVVLPVYSYSLKAVAKYLGFAWSHPEASAVQSMFWYSSWLKSGDRSFLDCAVEYNADDCRATRLLKEWLARGPASPVPAPGAAVGAAGTMHRGPLPSPLPQPRS